jgi:hypothetical protein
LLTGAVPSGIKLPGREVDYLFPRDQECVEIYLLYLPSCRKHGTTSPRARLRRASES